VTISESPLNRGGASERFFAAAQILIPAVVLIVLYRSTLVYLVSRWEKQPEYGYGFLILPIVGYLIWLKRHELAAAPSRPSWQAAWALLGGVFLFWLGTLGGEYFTLYISLWLVVIGLLWLAMGWRKLKVIAFPLAFALTMFPPPYFVHNVITLKLQLLSSRLGVFLIQGIGLPAFREGNVIDLGFIQLQVVEACSGLNSLISLGVLGVLVAYLYRAALWKRLFLVVSTIPIAVVTNGLRIAMTGLIGKHWGVEYAQGFFHDFSSWLMFLLELLFLYGVMVSLKRLPGRTGASAPARAADIIASIQLDQAGAQDRTAAISDRRRFRSGSIRIGLATAGLLLTMGLPNIEAHHQMELTQPFSHFPNRIGEWVGQSQAIEPVIIDALDLTDYVLMNYQGSDHQIINFYTAFYAGQSKGESIHSPATCYPGSGWTFNEVRNATVPCQAGANGSVRVKTVVMEKGGQRQLMYYWFILRGRAVTNYFFVKWFNFWDIVVHERSDGALVRLVTPIAPAETLNEAQTRLDGFTSQIVPVLREFIPN